jgi:hypothetical protein
VAYTLKVVDIRTDEQYELPADTVTLEEPIQEMPLAVTKDAEARAIAHRALVPLGYRPPGEQFYVAGSRWSELAGKPLRVQVSPHIRWT